MSRIGRKPIHLPQGVDATIAGNSITIKGPKGTLSYEYNPIVSVQKEKDVLHVIRPDDEKFSKQLHGTVRANIANMVNGVVKGYSKSLEIKGIGFRATLQGTSVVLSVGYTHTVTIDALPNTKIEVTSPTDITVSGTDKQAVGEVAARIRNVRRPEPYQGKGIAYKGEHIRRKEGKKAGKK